MEVLSLFLIFWIRIPKQSTNKKSNNHQKFKKIIASSFKEKTDFYEANQELLRTYTPSSLNSLRFSSIKKNIEDPNS